MDASPLLKTWCPPYGLDYPLALELKDGNTRKVRQVAYLASERSASRERLFWLHYDDGGRFYATEQIRGGGELTASTTAIIQPGRAMQLLFSRILSDEVFMRSVCAHLESPQFGFIDEIGTSTAPHCGKEKVRKKKALPVFEWVKNEPSEEKQDTEAVVFKRAETTGGGFEGLDG